MLSLSCYLGTSQEERQKMGCDIEGGMVANVDVLIVLQPKFKRVEVRRNHNDQSL